MDVQNQTIPLEPIDAQYMERLLAEIVYAQKAWTNALTYMRKRYNTPDSEWQLNNIETGFERVVNVQA
jgi:hypothetical protein